MSLQKSLPRIAARVLKNTHVGLERMKEKFNLIETAYGKVTVEDDFEKWCNEWMSTMDAPPRYPLSEYVKVVDQRLGPQFAEPRIETKDPRISQISAVVYERTGYLPTVRSVAVMLAAFPFDEIIEAVKEFAGTLTEKESHGAMRTFFADGGGSAVIIARRQRK